MRDFQLLRTDALAEVARLGVAAARARTVEAALVEIARAAFDFLGDREAHLRPGALKGGERQFFVSGIFLLLPGRSGHILVAEHGFPAEQHRLKIPIDTGHPGHVWRTREPLILANTDEHAEFKQILKTARMGSALYVPMFQHNEMVGQLICAAQARNTFAEVDLEVLCAFAGLAALSFAAHDGGAWLNSLASSG